MKTVELSIPTLDEAGSGNLPVQLKAGTALFLVGPNGAGKSALLVRMANGPHTSRVKYISALRSNQMVAESVELTPSNRLRLEQSLQGNAANGRGRTQDVMSAQWAQMLLYDLDRAKVDRSTKIAALVDQQLHKEAAIASASTPEPLDTLNKVLSQSSIEAQIAYDSASSKYTAVKPDGTVITLENLSDGERAAIQIAVATLTAPTGTIFLVDEPERHLYRGISAPLLQTIFAARADCAFVVATHDADLAANMTGAQVVLVRSCHWTSNTPHAWNLKLLPTADGMPEDLRRALVGSRRNILFVEGTGGSVDKPLYEALFKETTVVPMGSCTDVIDAVSGLRASETQHDVHAVGLIDRDDREDHTVEAYQRKGVFALEVIAAEALYYSSPSLEAVNKQIALAKGMAPEDAATSLADARTKALNLFRNSPELVSEMVSKKIEARVREKLLAMAPKWMDIKKKPDLQVPEISFQELYATEKQVFDGLLLNANLDGLMQRYPLHKVGVPAILASGALCNSRAEYASALVSRLQADVSLKSTLLAMLGDLPSVLPVSIEATAESFDGQEAP